MSINDMYNALEYQDVARSWADAMRKDAEEDAKR